MMNKEQTFSIWSPTDSIWSPWVKPVLFAYAGQITEAPELSPSPNNFDWCPRLEDKTVVVLDLPGEESILIGMALAQKGYRPVPLYNSIPAPLNPGLQPNDISVVNVWPILNAMQRETQRLAALSIKMDAPPVFLLDANRHGPGKEIRLDQFDNRSICFTTDFPSANFLLAHGFQKILLITRGDRIPKNDLSHVLRRWQDGNLKLERFVLGQSSSPKEFQVSRPSWYGAMFQRALAAIGLHPNTSGSFGGWMHDSTASG